MSDPAPEVRALGGGRFEVVDGERRRLAYAVRDGRDVWVFVDGRVHVVGEARRSTGGRHEDDQMALAAPMPATVVAIHVDPGQAVARGDLLVTLEAMKMELAIKAPHDGIVRRIACRAGELVQPSVPLLDLDPADRS